MDEMVEDEDERISVNDVPFVAERDFLLKYGNSFALEFSEQKQVVLTALANPA